MTPLLLRQFWSLIEATQSKTLLSLDDQTLIQWLTRQLGMEFSLNHCEVDTLNHYISSRLSLIRDIADAR
ncbi:MAG: hypothetical protein EA367_05020 [Leptolyngbya sp. DLM2.Bin15]|uniref:hypothetical protein n=1 Tax=Leptolyngbya sp. CCY15150 TaxID=2767772 RepID=UPI00138162BF|nr:hypothetical protein [Leptolyngbya sp. CCY15150]TVQ21936.1 MAG: hypothetical protein EA367_05020 [Leptolyngbya sp. DLM2.Bin15]